MGSFISRPKATASRLAVNSKTPPPACKKQNMSPGDHADHDAETANNVARGLDIGVDEEGDTDSDELCPRQSSSVAFRF